MLKPYFALLGRLESRILGHIVGGKWEFEREFYQRYCVGRLALLGTKAYSIQVNLNERRDVSPTIST